MTTINLQTIVDMPTLLETVDELGRIRELESGTLVDIMYNEKRIAGVYLGGFSVLVDGVPRHLTRDSREIIRAMWSLVLAA